MELGLQFMHLVISNYQDNLTYIGLGIKKYINNNKDNIGEILWDLLFKEVFPVTD